MSQQRDIKDSPFSPINEKKVFFQPDHRMIFPNKSLFFLGNSDRDECYSNDIERLHLMKTEFVFENSKFNQKRYVHSCSKNMLVKMDP